MATQSQQTWAVRELQRRKMEATTPKEKIALQRDILRAQRDPAYLEELARIGEKGKWSSGVPFKAKLGLAGLALSPLLGVPAAAAGLGTLGLAAMGIPTGLEALSRRRAGMPWGWQALESGLDVAAPGIGKAVGAVRAAGGAKRAAAEAAKAAKPQRVLRYDPKIHGTKAEKTKAARQESDDIATGRFDAVEDATWTPKTKFELELQNEIDKNLIDAGAVDPRFVNWKHRNFDDRTFGRILKLPDEKPGLIRESLIRNLDREFPKINPLHSPHISSQLVDPRQGGKVVQTSGRLTGDELERGVVRPGEGGLKIDLSEAEKAELLKKSPPTRHDDWSDKGAVLNQWFHRPGVGWTRRGLGDDISRAPGSPLSRGEQASEFISQGAYDDLFRSLTNKGLSPEEARSSILRPLEKLGSFRGSGNLYQKPPLSKADAEGVMAARMPTATPQPTVTPQRAPTSTPSGQFNQASPTRSLLSDQTKGAGEEIADKTRKELTKEFGPSKIPTDTPPTTPTVEKPTVKTPTVDTLKTPALDQTTVGRAFNETSLPPTTAETYDTQVAATNAVRDEIEKNILHYGKITADKEGQEKLFELAVGGRPGASKIAKKRIESLAGSVIGPTKGGGQFSAGRAGRDVLNATISRFTPAENTAIKDRLSARFTKIMNDPTTSETAKKNIRKIAKPDTSGPNKWIIHEGKAYEEGIPRGEHVVSGKPNMEILRLKALLGVSERSKVYGKILKKLVTKKGDRTMQKPLDMMEASFGQAENNIIYGKAYDEKKTEAIIKAITNANIELSALIAMIGGSQIMTQGTPPDATNR